MTIQRDTPKGRWMINTALNVEVGNPGDLGGLTARAGPALLSPTASPVRGGHMRGGEVL